MEFKHLNGETISLISYISNLNGLLSRPKHLSLDDWLEKKYKGDKGAINNHKKLLHAIGQLSVLEEKKAHMMFKLYNENKFLKLQFDHENGDFNVDRLFESFNHLAIDTGTSIPDSLRILEIDSPTPSIKEVKKAYHLLARKFHPDKAKSKEEERKFTKIFQDIQDAYSSLEEAIKSGKLQNVPEPSPDVPKKPQRNWDQERKESAYKERMKRQEEEEARKHREYMDRIRQRRQSELKRRQMKEREEARQRAQREQEAAERKRKAKEHYARKILEENMKAEKQRRELEEQRVQREAKNAKQRENITKEYAEYDRINEENTKRFFEWFNSVQAQKYNMYLMSINKEKRKYEIKKKLSEYMEHERELFSANVVKQYFSDMDIQDVSNRLAINLEGFARYVVTLLRSMSKNEVMHHFGRIVIPTIKELVALDSMDYNEYIAAVTANVDVFNVQIHKKLYEFYKNPSFNNIRIVVTMLNNENIEHVKQIVRSAIEQSVQTGVKRTRVDNEDVSHYARNLSELEHIAYDLILIIRETRSMLEKEKDMGDNTLRNAVSNVFYKYNVENDISYIALEFGIVFPEPASYYTLRWSTINKSKELIDKEVAAAVVHYIKLNF